MNMIDFKIKDWYIETYPTDELGQEINPNVTFKDVYKVPAWFYHLVGVGDSLVRERVFEKVAEIKNIDYSDVYNSWLNGMQIGEFCGEVTRIGSHSNNIGIHDGLKLLRLIERISNDE